MSRTDQELKAMGAEKLPTADQGRNAAWLQLAALAVTVTAWLRHLALDGDLRLAEPKALRFRLLAVPARLVRHARYLIMKIPDGWAWADDLINALEPAPRPAPRLTAASATYDKERTRHGRSGTGSHPGTRATRTPQPQSSRFMINKRAGQLTRHPHESSWQSGNGATAYCYASASGSDFRAVARCWYRTSSGAYDYNNWYGTWRKQGDPLSSVATCGTGWSFYSANAQTR